MWFIIISVFLGILIGIGILILLSSHIVFVEKHRNFYDNIKDYGKDDDYTTLSQSKTLINLGLLEKAKLLNPSAYYIYYSWVYNTTPIHSHTTTPTLSFEKVGDDCVPCWSNERLISLISSVSDNGIKIKKKGCYYSIRLRIKRKFYITGDYINLTDLLFDVVYNLLKENKIGEEN